MVFIEKLKLRDEVSFRAYNNNIIVVVSTRDLVFFYQTVLFGKPDSVQVETKIVHRAATIEEAKETHARVVEILRGSDFRVKISGVRLTMPSLLQEEKKNVQ